MKRKSLYALIILVLVVLAGRTLYTAVHGWGATIETYIDVSRLPRIRPDYTNAVIPWNIAPLNFTVLEPGTAWLVKIWSDNGDPLEIFSAKNRIRIPRRRWRLLLKANRGKKLFFDVYVRTRENGWKRYQTVSNTIANEDIDSHIAYRLIEPVYNTWQYMGIYQRNLENYDESAVLYNESFAEGCVNCHSFADNRPETMIIGIRSRDYGSSAILAHNGRASKIGTKFGYTAWHPSGRLAAYAMTKVHQFFHTTGIELRDVIDMDSYIAYYLVDSQATKTTPALSKKDRLETYPAWSADGRYLYFCSAPILWTDRDKIPPARYAEVKYDLKRISYDVQSDQWGLPETVLSAGKTGLSILLPRVSPDGKYLLFCMCKYGCFPVFQPGSDLYLMNLETAKYHKLEINSEYSESWHSWSSNSRWIAFSSKRDDGLFTRLYISYVDHAGKVYKPFVIPQKNPAFYDSFIKTFSVPELITGPVTISPETLARTVRKPAAIDVTLPITGATVEVSDTNSWRRIRE